MSNDSISNKTQDNSPIRVSHSDAMPSILAPVGILCYNRPEHLQKVLNGLAANSGSEKTKVFIFIDGAYKPEDIPLTQAVKQVGEDFQQKQAFESLEIHPSDTNLGIFGSIQRATKTLFQISSRAIFIEDDSVPHPQFLEFMNTCLEKYESNSHVLTIGGYSHNHFDKWVKNYPHDTIFTYSFHAFAWATWKNKWQEVSFDIDPTDLFFHSMKERRRAICYTLGELLALKKEMRLSQTLQLWDVRFAFYHYRNQKFAIWPKYSYIQNIGFDGSGFHNFNFKQNYFAFELKGKRDSLSLGEPVFSEKMHKKLEFFISVYWVKAFISEFFRKLKLNKRRVG